MLQFDSGTSRQATLHFTAVANDGSNPASGAVTQYDFRYIDIGTATDCSAYGAADYGTATTEAVNPTPVAAPGTTETVQIALPDSHNYCVATKAIDGSGNSSDISNWVLAHDTTSPNAPANIATSGVTSNSVSITFTAQADDGDTQGGAAHAYLLHYTVAASCSSFDFASATALPIAQTPSDPGSPETIQVSGLNQSTSYCFGIEIQDAYGNSSGAATVAATTAGPTPSTDIAAVRAAIESAQLNFNKTVNSAVVTYVKSAQGGAAVGTADGPGFFIQGTDSSTGPAIFVALDPTTAVSGGLAVGDVVTLQVTGGTRFNQLDAVTVATVSRSSTGATLPAAQDVSGLDAGTWPLPLPFAPAFAYESELVTALATLPQDAGFVDGGNGFETIPVFTAGVTGVNADLQLRLPYAVANDLSLAPGMKARIITAPMWRNGTTAQLAAWKDADLDATPIVTAISPADGSTHVSTSTPITVTFNVAIDGGSVGVQSADGSCSGDVQVLSGSNTADAGANCLGLTEQLSADGKTLTLTPVDGVQADTRYQLKVTTGLASLTGLASKASTETNGHVTEPANAACTSRQVVISQVYGGGGNGGATWTNDFIELHNRGETSVDVSGWTVYYGSAAGTSWSSKTTLASGTSIAAGGYLLIAEASGGANGSALSGAVTTGNINLAAAGGKVALVNGSGTMTAGACPTAPGTTSIIDFVGFGPNNCNNGSAAPSGNAASVVRNDSACTDTASSEADFNVSTTVTPRNASTAANFCSCSGGTSVNADGTGSANGELAYCNIQFPVTLSAGAGATTDAVYGQLYQPSVTPTSSGSPSVTAELGYGALGLDPTTEYVFYPAAFNAGHVGQDNNDEYMRALTAPSAAGSYGYVYRFSVDQGAHWTYCDTDGAGSGGSFSSAKVGVLTVH